MSASSSTGHVPLKISIVEESKWPLPEGVMEVQVGGDQAVFLSQVNGSYSRLESIDLTSGTRTTLRRPSFGTKDQYLALPRINGEWLTWFEADRDTDDLGMAARWRIMHCRLPSCSRPQMLWSSGKWASNVGLIATSESRVAVQVPTEDENASTVYLFDRSGNRLREIPVATFVAEVAMSETDLLLGGSWPMGSMAEMSLIRLPLNGGQPVQLIAPDPRVYMLAADRNGPGIAYLQSHVLSQEDNYTELWYSADGRSRGASIWKGTPDTPDNYAWQPAVGDGFVAAYTNAGLLLAATTGAGHTTVPANLEVGARIWADGERVAYVTREPNDTALLHVGTVTVQ